MNKTQEAIALQERTTLLEIRFRRPLMTRRVEVDEDMVLGMENDWGHVSKDILQSDWYSKIVGVSVKVRKWMKAKRLTFAQYRRGIFRVPLPMVQDVYAYLEGMRAQHNEYLDCFIAEYDQRKKDAKIRLHKRYNEADYPSAESLKAAFAMDWGPVEVAVPSADKIGSEIHDAEMKRQKQRWIDDAQQVKYALRQALRDTLEALRERLTPGQGRKQKQLKAKMFGRIKDFLDGFEQLNVLDDAGIQKVVEKAKALLEGKTMDEIKDDEFLKAAVVKETAAMIKSVDKLLVDAPRAISFTDD